MLPQSIRMVTDLPPNAKLREMQQNTHGLVQLIRATTPHAPMPQVSKQLNACYTTLAVSGVPNAQCGG